MANSRTGRPGQPRPDESRVVDNEKPHRSGSSTAEANDPQRLAQRAYELFQMRGGEHGRDQEDWFAAERELKGSGE
jgi:hypothetical protein